jgi:hypothetical protein
MYNIRSTILEERFSGLPRERRVLLAFMLGCIIIFIAKRGYVATKSDILFAQMLHASVNAFITFLLFIGIYTRGFLLRKLHKISGILFCFIGIVTWIKVYTTLVESISARTYELANERMLLLVSISIVFLSILQMASLWGERKHMLGETKVTSSPYATKRAPRSSYIVDFALLSTPLIEYALLLIFPNAPLFIRFVDMAIALYLGWWILLQGVHVLIPKVEYYRNGDRL